LRNKKEVKIHFKSFTGIEFLLNKRIYQIQMEYPPFKPLL